MVSASENPENKEGGRMITYLIVLAAINATIFTIYMVFLFVGFNIS